MNVGICIYFFITCIFMGTHCPGASVRAGQRYALFPRVMLACRRLNPPFPKPNVIHTDIPVYTQKALCGSECAMGHIHIHIHEYIYIYSTPTHVTTHKHTHIASICTGEACLKSRVILGEMEADQQKLHAVHLRVVHSQRLTPGSSRIAKSIKHVSWPNPLVENHKGDTEVEVDSVRQTRS